LAILEAMAEFKSHDDYWRFARSVIRHARYVFEPHVDEFLSTVLATVKDRIAVVEPEAVLHRGQLGFEWRRDRTEPENPDSETVEIEDAYGPERMKPLRDSAREGRINAKGIPCLYLSDDENTAMAETRPWIGSFVSLADFIVFKELRLVNCCEPRHQFRHFFLEPPYIRVLDPKTREEVAWGEISYAFSEPVTPTDITAEYAPTQIISDLFRRNGYDGIRYKSLLGQGYNYAFFDLDAADLYSCQLHAVKNVHFDFDACRTPYVNHKYYRPSS
jgi:hypothetical protein